jgi:hypothetical protein
MTDRVSRQRQQYESQLTSVSAQLTAINAQLAALTTERDKYKTDHTASDAAHKKAIADMDALKADYTLSGTLTEIGGAMDPAVKAVIIARYGTLEAKDRPEFKAWLGTDVVAKALLGSKAPVPPVNLPGGNNGTKPDVDPLLSHNLTAEGIRNMSIDELKKHRDAIKAGKFSVGT